LQKRALEVIGEMQYIYCANIEYSLTFGVSGIYLYRLDRRFSGWGEFAFTGYNTNHYLASFLIDGIGRILLFFLQIKPLIHTNTLGR
jgi:hypothetical protein